MAQDVSMADTLAKNLIAKTAKSQGNFVRPRQPQPRATIRTAKEVTPQAPRVRAAAPQRPQQAFQTGRTIDSLA